MKSVVRAIVGVVLGLFVALVLVIAVEFFSDQVHPLPQDFDGTMEAMCRHVEKYPAWVLAVVVPAWAITAYVGTWVARKIGTRGSAAVVGLLLVLAVAFNVSKLPYPFWFKGSCQVSIPFACLAAVLWSSRPAISVSSEPA